MPKKERFLIGFDQDEPEDSLILFRAKNMTKTEANDSAWEELEEMAVEFGFDPEETRLNVVELQPVLLRKKK